MEGVILLQIARWAGILAMLVIFFQMLSMGKGRTLEKVLSKTLLVKLHRKGIAPLSALLLLHAGAVVYGRSLEYEDTLRTTLSDFFLDRRWGTVTGFGIALLLFALGMTLLFLRKKLTFPTFKKTHFLMYVAVPMLFLHQIFFGLDFITSTWLTTAWTVLFIMVAADILLWKVRLHFMRGGRVSAT